MKISILGQDTLAHAVTVCCTRHFEVSILPAMDASIAWFCDDTPIAPNDRPDWGWVLNRIIATLPSLSPKTLILVSSQLPVGSISRLESAASAFRFAYSPENIRVATAVADFENQARVVVGVRSDKDNALLSELFAPFTQQVIFMSVESAECTKHFLNTFLGLQIAFANEASRFCKAVGADPMDIYRALITDQRVSPKAPLKPGAPFGGGHLARDIFVVNERAQQEGLKLPLISHIMESNRS